MDTLNRPPNLNHIAMMRKMRENILLDKVFAAAEELEDNCCESFSLEMSEKLNKGSCFSTNPLEFSQIQFQG